RSSLIAFGVLFFFIVIGQLILEWMNITLDAFQISGGVILFLFSLTMIFGNGKPKNETEKITDYRHVTVFPIAVPSIASPGAIMAVVLLTDNHIYTVQQQMVTTFLVLLIIGVTYLILLSANQLQNRIGSYGISVISRIMGLILASYAVQSILNGLDGHFANYQTSTSMLSNCLEIYPFLGNL
ncbi:MAG: MarC family protein, partial [Bacteroidota bacterium]